MIRVFELSQRVANSQANLLIRGEAGSGKEELAQAIHGWSNRGHQPLAIVQCRPGDAIKLELFGTAGKIEQCDGGTLLLKDVDQLPSDLQSKIYSLLKEREFEPIDQTTRRSVNLRVIATSSIDLQQAAAQYRFRIDLSLALNVVQIDIPPLRDRPADIPLLADQYLAALSRSITGFTSQAMYVLTQYRWPGNIRELRNLIERAVLLCRDEKIGIEHLPPNLLGGPASVSIGELVPLARVEELHIRRVVASARSLRQAAKILGMDAGTLVRRMKRYREGDGV